MSYWKRATADQLQALKTACKGKVVLDIGGFDASLANEVINGGATKVTVLDKENPTMSQNLHPGKITQHMATFAEFARNNQQNWEVGIISWPANNEFAMRPVVEILKRCKQIIYLGSNQEGTQCGTLALWEYLVTRNVEQAIETRNQQFIVYGHQPRPAGSALLKEEVDGLEAGKCMYA